MAGGLSPIGFGAPAPQGFGGGGGLLKGAVQWLTPAAAALDPGLFLCDGSAIEITAPGSFPFATRPVAIFDPAINPTPDGSLYSMAYGNGVYLLVAGGGNAYWSTDRKTWTKSLIAGNASIPTAELKSVAFGLGGFVIVGENNFVGYTTDGKTITATNTQFTINNSSPGWQDVVFEPASQSFVAISGSVYSSGSGAYAAACMYLTTLSNSWTRAGNFEYGSSQYNTKTLFVLNGSVWAAIQNWNQSNMVIGRSPDRGASWEYRSFDAYTGQYITTFPRPDGSFVIVGHYSVSSWYYSLPANATSVNNITTPPKNYTAGGDWVADLGSYTLYNRGSGANAKAYLDTDPNMGGAAAVTQPLPAGNITRSLRVNGIPILLAGTGGYREVRAVQSGFVLPIIAANTNKDGTTLNAYMKVA